MRPIDADDAIRQIDMEKDGYNTAFLLQTDSYTSGAFDALDRAISVLEAAPTLDAVPVVRCKDCTKWDKSTMEHYEDVFSGSGDTAECRMFCDMDTWGEFTDDMRRTDGNWFCADGERKEDA